jgi:heme-degrading monooxygenase HmoA
MMFVSLTRLRIRSFRFVPRFALHTFRSLRQVKMAPGFQRGALLVDRSWTFWTMTAWDTQESMRRYMTAGSHKAAMPHLLHWCDEASVAHWEQPETALPSWTEADKRMREDGRASKVLNPSPQHATLSYRTPRTTGGVTIRGRGITA